MSCYEASVAILIPLLGGGVDENKREDIREYLFEETNEICSLDYSGKFLIFNIYNEYLEDFSYSHMSLEKQKKLFLDVLDGLFPTWSKIKHEFQIDNNIEKNIDLFHIAFQVWYNGTDDYLHELEDLN